MKISGVDETKWHSVLCRPIKKDCEIAGEETQTIIHGARKSMPVNSIVFADDQHKFAQEDNIALMPCRAGA